jgi:hypothetical protein
MAKSPGDRPQSMAEVARAIEGISGRASGRMPVAPSEAPTMAAPGARTTLSGSAGESIAARRADRPRGRARAVVAGSVALAGLGVAAALLLHRPPVAPRPAAPAAVAPPIQPPAPSPPPQPSAPAPESIHVLIDSQPAGADVYRASDGVRVGRTPFSSDFSRTQGEAIFVLKLAGYREERVATPVDRDSELVLRLTPKAKAPPREAPAASKPAAKPARVKDGALDPFAQ